MVFNEFFDVEPIGLRWVPGDKGDVYLYVSSPRPSSGCTASRTTGSSTSISPRSA